MKDVGETLHRDHPGALLLPYLEQMLSEDDRTMVEQHLEQCDACSRELRALEEMVAVLVNNKDALCPEPWELYEFVERGQEKDRNLQDHLDACPSCAAEVARYRSGRADPVEMPERVLDAYQKRFVAPPVAVGKPDGASKVVVLAHWIRSRSRRAVMATVAMAVAAMLAVMIYPRGPMEPMFGLSSVTWEQSGHLLEKSMPVFTARPRVAVMLIFKDFRRPLSQDKIDALYEELRPSPAVADRFHVIKPMAVKNAISGKGIKGDDRHALLLTLSGDLDVSRVLLIVVTETGEGFDLSGEFVGVKSKEVIRKQTGHVSGEPELLSGMGKWMELLIDD